MKIYVFSVNTKNVSQTALKISTISLLLRTLVIANFNTVDEIYCLQALIF